MPSYMSPRCLLLFACSALLLSTTCKKDYYDGPEFVLLPATLNNANETIRLTDTLKVTLTLPSVLTSESGTVVPVNSVQEVLYNLELYQVDTVHTNLATGAVRVERIVSPSVLVVTKGGLNPNMSSVYTTTGGPPFQSVLQIIPPTKGVYYMETRNGSLKVNNGFGASLGVHLNVPTKHWTLADKYIAGYSTAPEILQADAQGSGPYWFRVK
jgi:hypothetical protein